MKKTSTLCLYSPNVLLLLFGKYYWRASRLRSFRWYSCNRCRTFQTSTYRAKSPFCAAGASMTQSKDQFLLFFVFPEFSLQPLNRTHRDSEHCFETFLNIVQRDDPVVFLPLNEADHVKYELLQFKSDSTVKPISMTHSRETQVRLDQNHAIRSH